MKVIKVQYKSPEWYELRTKGIGGSDAASALGMNPWRSNIELWEEKVGIRTVADISNARMEYGTKAEEHITALFDLDHPEYEVKEYKDVVFVNEFMFASIDGGLIEKATGRQGGLEVKTTEPRTKATWDQWDNQVPQYYYIQVLHYLAVTGWDFWILKCRFKSRDFQGNLIITEKEYRFEREECKSDIEYLIQQESKFWKSVVNKIRPGRILPMI